MGWQGFGVFSVCLCSVVAVRLPEGRNKREKDKLCSQAPSSSSLHSSIMQYFIHDSDDMACS